MVERDSYGPEQIYTAGADLQHAIDKPAASKSITIWACREIDSLPVLLERLGKLTYCRYYLSVWGNWLTASITWACGEIDLVPVLLEHVGKLTHCQYYLSVWGNDLLPVLVSWSIAAWVKEAVAYCLSG